MWPNTDKRRLLMKSITGGKPVRADIFCVCDMLRPVYIQDLALALHVECLRWESHGNPMEMGIKHGIRNGNGRECETTSVGMGITCTPMGIFFIPTDFCCL